MVNFKNKGITLQFTMKMIVIDLVTHELKTITYKWV